MSFFANLLGGAMQGFGAGVSAMGADEERLAQQRALIQERSQAALDLQRQRADDRLYQQEQLLQMKSELGGGGSGGGGKGINLAQLAMQAKTPEEQQRVISLARTFAGDDAGALMAEQLYGRAQTTAAPPTAGDFARYDRAGDMEAAPPKTTLERASYDADRGRQALQRAYTLFLDPGKTDDFAKGERQFGLNDFGAANAAQVMQRGGSLPEASAAFQRFSGTKDESVKDDLAAERAANAAERNKILRENAAMRESGQAVRNLDKQIADAYKALSEARPKDKPAVQARIQELETRRGAPTESGAVDAKNNYQPGATKRAPSPTDVLPNPASRAAAWKSKFGATQ